MGTVRGSTALTVRISFVIAALGLAGASFAQGTQTGSNGFYDVAVNANGTYTARTGSLHPGPNGVNVLYGGSTLTPGTTWNTVRSYATSTEYVMRGAAAGTSLPFSCTDLGSVATVAMSPLVDPGGGTSGVRSVWQVASGADRFRVTQEVNAEGATFESSVVRVTLCIRNDGAAPASYGLRMQWDWQVDGNDGPFFGERPPNPPLEPLRSTETDFVEPVFGSYDISDTQRPSVTLPTYRVGGTVNEPLLSPPPTHPSLVQYIGWSSANSRCFQTPNTGATIGSESWFLPTDSAVNYFWGEMAGNAVSLAPGEEFCATQYLFVFTIEPPPLCSVTPVLDAGGACAGDAATLSGASSYSSDCSGPLEYQFTDELGAVVQGWSADPDVDVTTAGVYTLEVRCATDPSCRDSAQASVKMETPPDAFAIAVTDADPCNPGLLVSWTGDWSGPAWGSNGAGTFTLRRSDVSCADARTQPPLASGLTEPSYIDLTATGGVSYSYLVTAEAATSAASCPPGPERGAPFSEACVSAPAIDDLPAPLPESVGPALRVRKAGVLPVLHWPTAPPLRAGEFDVVLSSLDPRTLGQLATGITTLEHQDDPALGRLIFYKVLRSNACGFVSSD